MAYIDRLYELACDTNAQDVERIAEISKLLYRRIHCNDFGSHRFSNPEECTRVQITNTGFTLSFGKTHVHYCRDSSRWLACERHDERPLPSDPHDVAVDRLSAPYAFLEGIAYCIECVEAVGMSEVDNRRAKGKSNDIDAAVKQYMFWSRQIQEMKKRFQSKAFQSMARARCVKFLEEYESTEPPPPPTETTTLDVAQAAFDGISGVYFLWGSNDKVDYVGRSNNIGKRLAAHHVATDSHRVSIVETTKNESHLLELYYIWKFRPPQNCQVRDSQGGRRSRVVA